MYENWKLAVNILHPETDDEESIKKAQEAQEEYTKVATWCNECQQYHIENTGEFYETVKNQEPTYKEKLEFEMYQLKCYLNDTDYITAKLAEVVDNIEIYKAMKVDYKEQLNSRESARVRIRKIKKELEKESE